MIVEQHYLGCLAQASYFIADEQAGRAVVVDPRRDVELYIERVAALGVKIERVLLTHFHADFLAGHLELAARTGARIGLGRRGEADYEHDAFADGDVLELGDVRIAVLETPGHTPESVCYVVSQAGSKTPHSILTGDTLFIGDVGRPDLMTSKGLTSEQLAGWLYDSLHDKILPLPDETIVYPGHGAGSACGKNLSSDTWSTLGKQRAENYALQPMAREDFVQALTTNLAAPPAYFPLTADLNRRQHSTLDEVLDGALQALDLEAVLAAQNKGAQVLDVRDKDSFAAAHLSGSISIGLDGKYASWAGTVMALDRDVILVAPPGAENEAALRLGRIGFDRVTGYLAELSALESPEHAGRVQRIDVQELEQRMRAGDAFVVDVRQPGEFANGHLAGALSIPLGELGQRASELPRDRTIYLQCQTGYRSMTAASLLANAGLHDVADVDGGFEAWQAAALPVQVEADSCVS